MLQLTTRECIGMHSVFPRTEPADIPIIMLIRTDDAISAIQEQFNLSRAENIKKMDNIRLILPSTSGAILDAPWVYAQDGKILYDNGRHRTWRIKELGIKTLPVCTMKRFALQLESYWAYTEDALFEYNFSLCKFDVFGKSKLQGVHQVSIIHKD